MDIIRWWVIKIFMFTLITIMISQAKAKNNDQFDLEPVLRRIPPVGGAPSHGYGSGGPGGYGHGGHHGGGYGGTPPPPPDGNSPAGPGSAGLGFEYGSGGGEKFSGARPTPAPPQFP